MDGARLLFLSNSRTTGSGYLEHALPAIGDFLGAEVKTIAFLPFAAVRFSYDAYEEMPVAGLREGSWMHREGKRLVPCGRRAMRLFRAGENAQEFEPGTNLSFLL